VYKKTVMSPQLHSEERERGRETHLGPWVLVCNVVKEIWLVTGIIVNNPKAVDHHAILVLAQHQLHATIKIRIQVENKHHVQRQPKENQFGIKFRTIKRMKKDQPGGAELLKVTL